MGADQGWGGGGQDLENVLKKLNVSKLMCMHFCLL